jgi:hypothetical protein
MIKIGDLCRVVVNSHTVWQLGDLVLITKIIGKSYIEGINTRTGDRHHYPKESLEKL